MEGPKTTPRCKHAEPRTAKPQRCSTSWRSWQGSSRFLRGRLCRRLDLCDVQGCRATRMSSRRAPSNASIVASVHCTFEVSVTPSANANHAPRLPLRMRASGHPSATIEVIAKVSVNAKNVRRLPLEGEYRGVQRRHLGGDHHALRRREACSTDTARRRALWPPSTTLSGWSPHALPQRASARRLALGGEHRGPINGTFAVIVTPSVNALRAAAPTRYRGRRRRGRRRPREQAPSARVVLRSVGNGIRVDIDKVDVDSAHSLSPRAWCCSLRCGRTSGWY